MSVENKENLPEIKISQATPEDVCGVAEVFYKTWLATYPNEELGITTEDIDDRYKEAFTEAGLAKRAERIAHPSENASFFIAKEDDKVIGVCNILRHPDRNQLQATDKRWEDERFRMKSGATIPETEMIIKAKKEE
jgi:hypothetical protein